MKIISLVPSLTELLLDLGLENQLVGRTKFCIHPKDKVKDIPKIGGTKNVRISAVQELKPDLIFANKEENTQADVEALQLIAPVHITEIANYTEAIDSIIEIGRLTNRGDEARSLVAKINLQFAKLESVSTLQKSVCYFIWQDPFMSIGSDTYIHDMLIKCGFKNVFGDQTRYPSLSVQQIQEANPELIFLSSEPFPFKDKHIAEIQNLCPNSKVILADGEYFSWYGSRMLLAADYFVSLCKEIENL